MIEMEKITSKINEVMENNRVDSTFQWCMITKKENKLITAFQRLRPNHKISASPSLRTK